MGLDWLIWFPRGTQKLLDFMYRQIIAPVRRDIILNPREPRMIKQIEDRDRNQIRVQAFAGRPVIREVQPISLGP